jgi:hypothetical protein
MPKDSVISTCLGSYGHNQAITHSRKVLDIWDWNHKTLLSELFIFLCKRVCKFGNSCNVTSIRFQYEEVAKSEYSALESEMKGTSVCLVEFWTEMPLTFETDVFLGSPPCTALGHKALHDKFAVTKLVKMFPDCIQSKGLLLCLQRPIIIS